MVIPPIFVENQAGTTKFVKRNVFDFLRMRRINICNRCIKIPLIFKPPHDANVQLKTKQT